MLDALPLFHFFDCGNSYCGEHCGMRYIIEAHKKDEETKELLADIWPEPWCREKTARELHSVSTFSYDQEGLDAAIAWLHEEYAQREEEWTQALREPWDVSLKKLEERKQREKEEAESAKAEAESK